MTEQLALTQPKANGLDLQVLMAKALESGSDGAATLERLVALQERIMDRAAAQEFAQAMANFQAECPVISKNRTAGGGNFQYDYAELDHIATTIRPYCQKHGLSYSFNSAMVEGQVKATCIIRHNSGHAETTEFTAPVDKGAKMNEPQKVASAVSYARRYALILAFGLTTGESDDDGRAAGSVTLSDEQVANIDALLDEIGREENFKRFLAFMKVNDIGDIAVKDYQRAITALEAKRASQ